MNAEQWPHPITGQEFFQHLLTAASHGKQLDFPLYESTPTVSTWPMRNKWDKYGPYWGYVLLYETRKDRNNRNEPIQCPPIQLAYARVGDTVIQAAHWSDLKLTH